MLNSGKISAKVRWRSQLILGLLVISAVVSGLAWAQSGDIIDPASDGLPPELSDDMSSDMDGLMGDGAMPDGSMGPDGLMPDPNVEVTDSVGGGLSEIDATWESYTDLGAMSGVAEEVTGGVRVEDIIEPPSEYRYAAFGRPDPFIAPLTLSETRSTIDGEREINPLEIPIVSPLQRFALDQLRLVGIWQRESGEKRGLVISPEQEGIVIKLSDPIGRRGGKVLAIGTDNVTVREFTLDPDGTRQYEDKQMFMGRPDIDELPGKIVFNPGDDEPEIDIEGMPEGVTTNPLAPEAAGAGEVPPGAAPPGANPNEAGGAVPPGAAVPPSANGTVVPTTSMPTTSVQTVPGQSQAGASASGAGSSRPSMPANTTRPPGAASAAGSSNGSSGQPTGLYNTNNPALNQ